MLGNAAAMDMVTGADIWEINANESVAYQYSRYNYNATIFFNAEQPVRDLGPQPGDRRPRPAGFTPTTPRRSRSSAPTTSTAGCCPDGGNAAGAAPFATAVKRAAAENPGNTIFAAAGDLIGASTFESFVQDDEPTIDALNEVGLEVSAAGNHEFDQGYEDLVGRVQDRADWDYIAANVDEPEGADNLAETWTKTVDGVNVGFVGAVTEDLPSLVSPGRHDGRDRDRHRRRGQHEAADDLKADGADIVVLLVHEGSPSTDCSSSSFTDPATVFGNIVNSVAPTSTRSSPATRTWPTTAATRWPTGSTETRASRARPVVSAGQYGTNLNQLVFNFDDATGDLLEIEQELVGTAGVGYDARPRRSRRSSTPPWPSPTASGNEVLGQIDGPFNARSKPAYGTTENRGGESTLGNLVAEVQRWATQLPARSGRADIAFMNPGGLRADMVGAANGDVPAT